MSIENLFHIKSGKFLMMAQRSTSQIGHDSLLFPWDNSGPSEGEKYIATFRQGRDKAALLTAVVGVQFQITWDLWSKKWQFPLPILILSSTLYSFHTDLSILVTPTGHP
jgi:hypothetical protein